MALLLNAGDTVSRSYSYTQPSPLHPIQPSECGERTGILWNEDYTGISENLKYVPVFVGDGTFTLSTDTPHSSRNAPLFLLSGNVTSGASTPINGVYNDISRTTDSLNGYITIAFRRQSESSDPTTHKTMLNSGSTALPYEPYGIKIPVETSEDILVNNLTSKEVNGLTVTRNADGSVSVKGTSTANTNLCIYNDSLSITAAAYQIIENGQYLIGGGIAGGAENEFILSARYDDALGGTPARRMRVPYGEEIPLDNSDGAYRYLCVYIAVWKDQTVDFNCKPYLKAVSATNNIYLGEVQTTRKIKKLTLTGQENFDHYGTSVFWVKVEDNNAMIDGYGVSNSYVFNPIILNVPTTIANNEFCLTSANGRLWIRNTNYSNADSFKSYLAAQYAAGTPVTVWYVLAEPTTGIVNEPLRKIGDYADTLSYEQAGVQIPTNRGNTVIDVLTELKPSEMYIKYQE